MFLTDASPVSDTTQQKKTVNIKQGIRYSLLKFYKHRTFQLVRAGHRLKNQ